MDCVIEVDSISCRYGSQKPVLENISFSVARRSVTMLLGANGSGKTTLLKCMTGQLRPYAGEIRLNGTSISRYSSKELAKLVAYVPQGLDRNIDYTVQDFIAFGRTPYLGLLEIPSEEDYHIARTYAAQHGILYLMDQKINAISGGERQLAYIVRALVQETPIVIMDEPMSALDFGNQAMILKIISDLAKGGKTVLLTSHNPNHALAISSEVLVIRQDRVIMQGKAENILTDNEALQQTFGPDVHCVKGEGRHFVLFTV